MKLFRITIAVASLAALATGAFGQGTTLAQMRAELTTLEGQVKTMQGTIDAQALKIKNLEAKDVEHDTKLKDHEDRLTNLASWTLTFVKAFQDLNLWKASVTGMLSNLNNLTASIDARTHFMKVDGNDTIFSNTNVIIRKDNGNTNTPNGLGNLIVGYNHPRSDNVSTLREGSHNIIFGDEANYRSMGCLIGGYRNGADANDCVILTGNTNAAHGAFDVIATGYQNKTQATNGFIATGWANELGDSGNFNFILSGFGNFAGYDVYNGILSGSNCICLYKGGVFGSGVNDGLSTEWAFRSN